MATLPRMSRLMVESQSLRVQRRDETLRRWGTRSWFALGVILVLATVFGLLSMISGLVVPLVVAVVAGILFVPAVDRLDRVVPRPLAAGIVLVVVLALTLASFVVAVGGLVDQAPEIGRRLADGFDELVAWLDEANLQVGESNQFVGSLADLWSGVVPGLAGHLRTAFSSTAAFFAGTFVAVFMLYFILADWERLTRWLAVHLGVSEEAGFEIIEDATWTMRQYFLALTVSSLIVAIIVGGTAAILGVPLPIAIAVVTFFTSYVPYLGALFSGAFAVLLALGSGGAGDAAIILVVVLVAQNLVQTIVQTKMSQDRLALHPIVIFGSTIIGGATLGLLGAALSTPAVALLVRVSSLLSQKRHDDEPE